MAHSLTHAIGLHEAGDFGAAEIEYRKVLADDPSNADALRLLGALYAQQDRIGEALPLIEAAIARRETPDLLHECGNLLWRVGRLEPALACFERASALEPDNVEALNNRGNILAGLRRLDDAVSNYDRALAIKPDLAEVLVNRGLALSQLGRFEQALTDLQRAMTLQPDFSAGWTNLAIVLRQLGRLEEAQSAAENALALAPDDPDALREQAKVLCERGALEESFASFTEAARQAWTRQAPSVGGIAAAHRDEQRAYLAARNISLGATLRLDGGARLAGAALTPSNAVASKAWIAAAPKQLVIDNFLTAAALKELRRFCWGSQIWWAGYERGYVGAFPESGLACPLMAQIAEEMRALLPDVFGAHALRYFWAFKYDGSGQGTRVHADEAAVNVNFWIAPEDANLDPSSGGLVLWDMAAPREWSYAEYNEDGDALTGHLLRAGAKSTTIPYRENRAVIFDSALLHATDSFHFREGFENQRINVTMLFGRRFADDLHRRGPRTS